MGCDLFREDTTILATGVVLGASPNQPAQGGSVALKMGWGLRHTVASARTEADGRYRLEHDSGDSPSLLALQVSTDLYDDAFSMSRYSLHPGERFNQTTPLYRNATLTVDVATDDPLSDGDSIFLRLPGTGGRYLPITTTHTHGPGYNEVRRVVERAGVTSEVADSVCCRVGSMTEHMILY